METTIWRIVVSAAVLGYGGYIWIQAHKVSTLYQSMFGVGGRNGILKRIDILEGETKSIDSRITETRHEINNKTTVLVGELMENIRRELDDIKSEVRRIK